MGGHGGLNILPQKRWNVYNFDNRERVKRDEAAAAREEQIRQQQEREEEAESRLVKLREAAHGRRSSNSNGECESSGKTVSELADVPQNLEDAGKIRHINLFDGWIGFQKVQPGAAGVKEYKGEIEVDKRIFRGDKELERLHKRATKEAVKIGKDGVEADDEHYKLGYGCLGRDRKRPWYLTKSFLADESPSGAVDADNSEALPKSLEKRKKTIDELREERLKREQQEREKANRLFAPRANAQFQKSRDKDSWQKRRPYYNSSFGNAR